MELAIATGGSCVHIIGTRKVLVQEGDVLLIHPGVRHGFEDCQDFSVVNIMYAPDQLPFPVLDGIRLPLFRYFFPKEGSVEKLECSPDPVAHFASREDLDYVVAESRKLKQELTSKLPGNILLSIIRLMNIIVSTLRTGQLLLEDKTEKRVFPMGKILDFLNRNITQDIPLDELARMAHFSRCAFQYKFKNLTGYCVSEYVLRTRIALAQSLLLKDPLRSVGEIGFECGYLDSNDVSRKFRQICKMSPSEYRRSQKAAKTAPAEK
ncbi:MAG: helix-turn-helix domain-containing protein [Victivallales bacterium]|nr:helix-turn-helix domain-containing protein [Victivallales bacterium]